MSDDLERLLTETLRDEAHRQIGDDVPAPPPRFAAGRPGRARRSTMRIVAPLAAAAAVAGIVVGALAAFRSTTTPSAGPPVAAVQVRLAPMPAGQVGVGMPVVAYFSRRFPNARAWQSATHVAVNGHRAAASWYFVRARGDATAGYPIAGHLRMRHFWPAHARITIQVHARGEPAGKDLAFAGDLHLAFRTGPACVVVVRRPSDALRVNLDGQQVMAAATAVGSRSHPTLRGTKVVMSKSADRSLRGPGYYLAHVKDVAQLTTTGEYLLAAPWNVGGIRRGAQNTSGSTDLLPGPARRVYRLLHVGDVVRYPDASGPLMTMRDGIGDWNVPWSQWQTGGLIPTR